MDERMIYSQLDPGISLDNAILLATYAHEGQLDKGDGGTYVRHPLRIMAALEPYGPVAQIAGVLHDVAEDTGITLDDFRTIGISEKIVEALDALKKRDGEDYPTSIARVKQNLLAKLVKLADNNDNDIPVRAALLSEDQQAKSASKYPAAHIQLIEDDPWLADQSDLIRSRIEALYSAEIAQPA